MKKFLLPLLATVMCLAGCTKDEPETIEKVRQLTFDGRTYELKENVCTFGKNYGNDGGNYSASASVELEDGYSTVFMCMFSDDVIGKSLDQLKNSSSGFYFRVNGILPYKGEVLYGGEIYVANMDRHFESSFKDLDLKVTKQDGTLSIAVEGTLNMGAKISFKTYFEESEISTY